MEVPTLHTLSKSHLKKRTGTWGPLLQWLHLDKCLLEQHMQGNYNGLKITTCVHSWDKLGARYKKAKTHRYF